MNIHKQNLIKFKFLYTKIIFWTVCQAEPATSLRLGILIVILA
jgi:hypothetical protein